MSIIHEFHRLGSGQCLGYSFWDAPSVMFIASWYLFSLYFCFQGVVFGALLNMPLSDRLGLGKVNF